MSSQTYMMNSQPPPPPAVPFSSDIMTIEAVEEGIRSGCLHFLRISALLYSSLYDLPLVDISPQSPSSETSTADEFWALSEHLKLSYTPGDKDAGEQTARSIVDCIHWPVPTPFKLVDNWCYSLSLAHQLKGLMRPHTLWAPPSLLNLPEEFEILFNYYQDKQCTTCKSVSNSPAVCLICGQLICYKDTCCQKNSIMEAAQHTMDCGSGTCVFLHVSSSFVLIVRGNRACFWGSLYLDKYGEEDKDLKRGKPLFLSKARYHLLQQQWRLCMFDQTQKRWWFHFGNV